VDDKEAMRLAKKYINRKPIPSSLNREFKRNGLHALLEIVYNRTAELMKDNQQASDEAWEHLGQILPSIAFYKVLLEKEGTREQALLLFEQWCFLNIKKIAKWIPVFLSIPGVYKKAPVFMKKVITTKFGVAAGFQFQEREQKNGFAVDMIKCPYVETCKKYGCPELAQFFCKSDDICYSNMHPKLMWDRSQTLGTGGDRCDFKLYIKL
jgi:hypothetical protein